MAIKKMIIVFLVELNKTGKLIYMFCLIVSILYKLLLPISSTSIWTFVLWLYAVKLNHYSARITHDVMSCVQSVYVIVLRRSSSENFITSFLHFVISDITLYYSQRICFVYYTRVIAYVYHHVLVKLLHIFCTLDYVI